MNIKKQDLLDEEVLNRLGYQQELYRGFNSIMNFCLTFTAVAVVSSLTSLYPDSIAKGGPATLFWSWVIASPLTIMTALSMAEICSTFPSAGSVYYWAGVMAPDGYGPFLAYITGWLNLLGNVAADSFMAYAVADFSSYLFRLYGYDPPTDAIKVAAGIAVLALWSLVNLLRSDHQGRLHTLGAFWQIICTFVVLFGLLLTCSQGENTLSDPTSVFFGTWNGTGFDSMPYVVLIGTLNALYGFSGYDSGNHLSEETQDAQRAVPQGMIWSCVLTALVGVVFILTMLFSSAHILEDFMAHADDMGITYIFERCMGNQNAKIVTIVFLINLFFSGMSSITVTIRTTFAMARDGGFPLAQSVKKVNRSGVPAQAVVTAFLMDSSLMLLPLVSTTAFDAVTSIATIGYQVSYAIPILLRITSYRHQFRQSSFHLGRWSILCGSLSCIFLITTSILFTLPVEYPLTMENFNYTSIVFAGVSMIAGGFWLLVGRYHFQGPVGIL